MSQSYVPSWDIKLLWQVYEYLSKQMKRSHDLFRREHQNVKVQTIRPSTAEHFSGSLWHKAAIEMSLSLSITFGGKKFHKYLDGRKFPPTTNEKAKSQPSHWPLWECSDGSQWRTAMKSSNIATQTQTLCQGCQIKSDGTAEEGQMPFLNQGRFAGERIRCSAV